MRFDQMEKKFNENEDEQGNSARIVSAQQVSVSLTSVAKRDHKIDDLTMIAFGFASASDILCA